MLYVWQLVVFQKKNKGKKKKYKNILKAHIFIPAQLQIGLNRHKVKFNGYLLWKSGKALMVRHRNVVSVKHHCVYFFIELANLSWHKREQVTVVDSSHVCLNLLTRYTVTTLPYLHVVGLMET